MSLVGEAPPVNISVIIPTFNREAIIRGTIESVLNQSRPPDQIVFCDDGSTDETVSAIHKVLAGESIPYKVLEITNSGPSNARKVAVDHADGDWLFFLDSDDRWHREYLAESERLIVSSGLEPDVIITNFQKVYLNGAGEREPSKFEQAPPGFWSQGFEAKAGLWFARGPWLFEHTLSFQPCFPSALACSRAIYDRVGGITLKSSSLKSEDSHFTRKLYFYGAVAFQQAVLVDILIHGGNRSMAGGTVLHAEKLSGKLEILKLMLEDTNIRAQSEVAVKAEIARERTALFNAFYWAGDHQRALKVYGELTSKPTPKIRLRKWICQFSALSARKDDRK